MRPDNDKRWQTALTCVAGGLCRGVAGVHAVRGVGLAGCPPGAVCGVLRAVVHRAAAAGGPRRADRGGGAGSQMVAAPQKEVSRAGFGCAAGAAAGASPALSRRRRRVMPRPRIFPSAAVYPSCLFKQTPRGVKAAGPLFFVIALPIYTIRIYRHHFLPLMAVVCPSETPSVDSGINRIQRRSQSKPLYLVFIAFFVSIYSVLVKRRG